MFLLFLYCCHVASAFYGYADIKLLLFSRKYVKSYYHSFWDITYSILEMYPTIFGCAIFHVMINLALLFFLFFQIRNISRNVTTIELSKYDFIKESRKSKGDITPITNFYDKGFINNWKQVIFPQKPEIREPYKIESE